MSKKSKLCTLMLAATFVLATPLSSCKNSSGGGIFGQNYVKLVDFESETQTVGLGENYTLPNGVVLDADGNDYRVIYEVKDYNGGKVSVSNGSFKVKELGKARYIITCYAQIKEEKYLTRTITLDVVDRAAPVITNDTMSFAFVGREYTIKGVKITDNSGETITPNYQVLDENGAEVTVTDGKFTPTSKGEYTLKITATDSSNNTADKTVSIYVREYMGDYVVENFNDEYGLPVFSIKQAGLTEDDVIYHETFDPTPDVTTNDDERVGVAEGNSVLSTSAEYGAHYYFKFDKSFAELGDFEYIYVKAYIKSSIAEYKPQVTLYSKNEPLGAGEGEKYNVNEWVEIRLTREDIFASESTFADPNEMRDGETPMDCFFRKMTTDSGYYLFWISNNEKFDMNGTETKDNANNYTLFVDEIGYKPVFNPTADIEESYDLGDWVTVEPTVVSDEAEDKYSIDVKITSPSGENVTLTNDKFRLVEAGEYTVELTYESDTYNGYTKYVINAISTKDITIGEYTATPTMGDVITIPDATIEGGTLTASVSIEGQQVAMESANSFKANVAGDYVVTYASEIDGLIYKKSITISVARGAYKANEVNSFSSKAEMTDNIAMDGFNAEWLASYEGANGVVKLTSPARWSYFAFKQLQEMNAYNDYDYVVIRIFVPETTTFGGASLYLVEKASCTFGAPGKWVEYAFSGDIFREFWKKTDFHAWTKCISMYVVGDIYIDDVYMMNDVSSLSLTPVVTNLTNAGETIVDGNKFSVALPTGAPAGAVVTVKAPDGNTVTDITNITANYGEYTIEITCEGYLGKVTQTVNVEGTFNFVLVGDNTVNGTEVSLKTYEVTMGSENVSANATVVINVTLSGYTQKIQVEDGKFTAPFTGATYNIEYVVTYDGATYNYKDTVTVESNYTVAENEVISFAEPTQMSKVHTYDSTVEWVAEYQGKTGVAKFTAKDWGYFGFETMQEMSAYKDATALVIRMYIETSDYSGSLWFGGVKAYEEGAVNAGEWLEVRFSIETFKENWAKTAADDYIWTDDDIWSMALSVGSAGTFYIDEIYTVTEEIIEDELPEGAVSVLAINDANSVTSILNSNAISSVEYVNEYEDAQGVLKITSTGWGRFNIKPTQDTASYANYKYLVVRMYIVADETPSLFLDPDGNFVYSTTTVETGKWVDYYFDGEIFYNQLVKGWNNYYTSICTNMSCTFYVDQVYMTNVEP